MQEVVYGTWKLETTQSQSYFFVLFFIYNVICFQKHLVSACGYNIHWLHGIISENSLWCFTITVIGYFGPSYERYL